MVFVALAALWASDATPHQLVQHLSATQIVVAEDALVTLSWCGAVRSARASALGAGGWGRLRSSRPLAGLATILSQRLSRSPRSTSFTRAFVRSAQPLSRSCWRGSCWRAPAPVGFGLLPRRDLAVYWSCRHESVLAGHRAAERRLEVGLSPRAPPCGRAERFSGGSRSVRSRSGA